MCEKIEQMVEDCENRESKMSDWERGFIQSMRENIDRGGVHNLSPNQIKVIEEIWEKVT